MCTLGHVVTPTFPAEPEYTKCTEIQELFRAHRTVPRLLRGTNLAAVFLDLDLSILGASEDDYDGYTKQIQEEYGCYSVGEYRNGRIKVMKGLLNRERLYFTDYFHLKYEARARENIEREIKSLEEHIQDDSYSPIEM
jgi:predicted metal-dependent HD superfamily phosphohydrolase